MATAHEHSYSRTHLLDDFETQSVASTSDTLVIDEGESFVFVSGLGGHSIRDQERDGPWWASIYTSDQDASFGALFCEFFMDGEPERALLFQGHQRQRSRSLRADQRRERLLIPRG